MKSKKGIHVLLIIGGLLLFFVSILGYPLGIAQREEFGALQWLGTITGAVIVIYSLIRLIRQK